MSVRDSLIVNQNTGEEAKEILLLKMKFWKRSENLM